MANHRLPCQVGLRFGKLTVLEENRSGMRLRCKVQCDCGTIEMRSHGDIKKTSNAMCRPCLLKMRAEGLSKRAKTHGLSKTPLYHVHRQMLRRCYNPQCKDYKNWGKRGIQVCDLWHDLTAFMVWALHNGYHKGLTIERKDVNGNYEPTNCTWIPNEFQALNRTNTRR